MNISGSPSLLEGETEMPELPRLLPGPPWIVPQRGVRICAVFQALHGLSGKPLAINNSHKGAQICAPFALPSTSLVFPQLSSRKGSLTENVGNEANRRGPCWGPLSATSRKNLFHGGRSARPKADRHVIQR